jgi:ATP-dependent Clp protease ATP-binding subunit ClpA
VKAEINRELERRFPPKFRNRIDQVVLFEPLDERMKCGQIALNYIEQVASTAPAAGQEPDG